MTVRAALALALVVAAQLAAASASAYRPPARALFVKAAEKQIERGSKTLTVEADTQLYDAAGGARGASYGERMLFAGPASMRREAELPEGVRVEIRVEDKLVLRAPGEADKNSRATVDVLFDHVTASPPWSEEKITERLLRDLKALGVNTEIVSFARFDGRVAYLIGSKPWESQRPQLWLDKDTLLPVRVVMISKGDDGKQQRTTDVRYLGWGSPIGGNWFPATIEVWVDGKLARRTAVKNVERNEPLDATLFK